MWWTLKLMASPFLDLTGCLVSSRVVWINRKYSVRLYEGKRSSLEGGRVGQAASVRFRKATFVSHQAVAKSPARPSKKFER
jgi:hypothetical protein